MVFIGPEKQQTFGQGAYTRYLYTLVQRLLRTSRYYPEGIPKSCVRLVLWRTSGVWFAGHTSDGPPLYIRTTDRTVLLSNLTYVWPKVQIALLASLVTQNPKLIPTTKLLSLINNLGHYIGRFSPSSVGVKTFYRQWSSDQGRVLYSVLYEDPLWYREVGGHGPYRHPWSLFIRDQVHGWLLTTIHSGGSRTARFS